MAGQMNAIERDEYDKRFEHYWTVVGKKSADVFIDCKLVPNESSFKEMLRAAYGMGWTESRQVIGR